ncbi:MAG: transcriptional regulator [Caulobacter sp.]
MAPGSYRFDRFVLDPVDRRLTLDGAPAPLSARYLDALILLVREPGRLVTKERFLEEVWRGVPVTDEALTQCIRALRRALGDDAASPRFIETAPKHGYRFIAPVEVVAAEPPPVAAQAAPAAVLPPLSLTRALRLGLAGTLGGGLAGAIGGLLYGFIAASQPAAAGLGAVSILLVLFLVTALIALVGGAGVAFGIAAASIASDRPGWWTAIGGAGGGLIVGAVVKVVGLDAFALLFGQGPGDITGAVEGAILGGGVGLGAWLAGLGPPARRLRWRLMLGALAGGLAGLLVALTGGRLMGGSLDLLARDFPGSRLDLAPVGRLLAEPAFGPLSLAVTAALEGALFSACIVGAMLLARGSAGRHPPRPGLPQRPDDPAGQDHERHP